MKGKKLKLVVDLKIDRGFSNFKIHEHNILKLNAGILIIILIIIEKKECRQFLTLYRFLVVTSLFSETVDHIYHCLEVILLSTKI